MNTHTTFRIILFFFLINILSGQESITFKKFFEDDGLSNGFVTSIHQDSKGFLWLGTANGVNRFDGYTFKEFNFDKNDSTSMSHPSTWAISEDSEGMLWFGTIGGLDRFDPATEKFTQFHHDPDDDGSISSSVIESIAFDKLGNLWVGTDNGLNRMKKGSTQFQRYWYQTDSIRLVKSIVLTKEGSLWTGSLDTLYQYDYEEDLFCSYPLPGNNLLANKIRVIYEDLEGYLWVGTELNGAFRFDKNVLQFSEHLVHDPSDSNSLSNNKISSFLYHEKKLWIGTSGGGLNIWDPASKIMNRFPGTSSISEGVNSTTIRNILKDKEGNIWLGSFYDGLYQFNVNQNQFLNYNEKNSLLSKSITGMAIDKKGHLWLGMDSGGIGLFDLAEKEFIKYFKHDPNDENSLPAGRINGLYVDDAGLLWILTESPGLFSYNLQKNIFSSILDSIDTQNRDRLDWLNHFLPEEEYIWLGTQKGLYKFHKEKANIQSYTLPATGESDIQHGKNIFVTAFLKDRQQNFWVATYGGLNRYHPKTDTFSFYPYPYQVLGLLEDHTGDIWVGTSEGLAKFDSQTQKIVPLNHPDLIKNPVSALIEDEAGLLWFANGSKGVNGFNPSNNQVKTINKKDGMISNHFWAGIKAPDGFLYFGGPNGLVAFNPDSIGTQQAIPPVVFTNFKLFNQTVPIRNSLGDTLSWKSPLGKSITEVKKIKLRHWQNYFSIEFATLSFKAPENNLYRYKLEGYDKNWVETSAQQRMITYTNLDPGTYTFHVQGAIRNGPWNEEGATLEIRILAPWWKTWWAYISYAILLFLVISIIYRFQLNKQLAENEAKRLKELDVAKNQLFTNVTHEFRTPLTVILGMAEKIDQDSKQWLTEGVQAIRRNGQQLLRLVNQMLDLSKLEANHLPLTLQQGDVIPFLSYLIQSYESYAFSNGAKLIFNKRVSNLVMDYSPDAFTKILNNLIFNAIKHTPDGGKIELSVDKKEDQLFMEVKDTGIGISAEHLPFIFDRFYLVDASHSRKTEGAGIGLALVKELVNKLNGKIKVESVSNIGTSFQIWLPITRKAKNINTFKTLEEINLERFQAHRGPLVHEPSDLPIVLLVEDNEDVARYIASCLVNNYQVHFATNGKEGLNKAFELVPDVIISDVMMPEMDGYTLCEILKNDERSSHIPIIMLTAKVDTNARLQGLRQGADGYLTKPFHPEELALRLNNLIRLRKKIHSHFNEFPEIQGSKSEFPKEHEFLSKIKNIILEHLMEDDFGIPELCLEVGISRSQLHRKLKAITGKSTSLIIRQIRLEEACKRLIASDDNVSEVAYQVGFKNPDYFTAVFSETYGQSPTHMREEKDMQQ